MSKSAILIGALTLVVADSFAFAGTDPVLDISGCQGTLVLRQSGGIKEPKLLHPGGTAGVQVHLDPSASGWVLRCLVAKASKSVQRLVGQSDVRISGVVINRAYGPGASAVQNIGGKNSGDSGSERATVRLQVPAGVRISAKNWTGSLNTEGGSWKVDAELASGQMHFSKLHDSVVVVNAGSLSALEATGRLFAHVRGAGIIDVANMRDVALNIELTGAGNMTFGGRATSARVLATGAGHIEIEQVTSEPWIQLRGAATLDVGR